MSAAVSGAKYGPMVVAAARVLCKRSAEQCNVDFQDSWKFYSEDYLADDAAALDAAAAPELLEALTTLHDKTAELIAHLQATERLRPCFNLPALDGAREALANATGAA